MKIHGGIQITFLRAGGTIPSLKSRLSNKTGALKKHRDLLLNRRNRKPQQLNEFGAPVAIDIPGRIGRHALLTPRRGQQHPRPAQTC
jgi:hypothetical protein